MTQGETTEDLPSRFQLDCLTAIGQLDAPKGVEIKDLLSTVYGTEINHGRLYPNLDELVEAGLVKKGSHDKRTNKYGLTRDGRAFLRRRIEWLAEGVPTEAAPAPVAPDGGDEQ